MNLELLKVEDLNNTPKYEVKSFKQGGWYWYYYTENLDYDFKFDDLKNGMKIFITDDVKKKLLIRKINKFFKDKNMDIKIVNDPTQADTICIDDSYKFKGNNRTLLLLNNIPVIYKNHYNTSSYNHDSEKEVIDINVYSNFRYKFKKYFNLKDDSEISTIIDGRYKFVQASDLVDVSNHQYVTDSSDININSEKLKMMLIEETSCEILCASLKDRDLSQYMEDIISSYYMTKTNRCRSLIKNRLLKRYKEADALLSYGDSYSNTNYVHIYYMNTMRNLKLTPDKEIVLQMVGYYK
jgi:hypothetical protein